MDINQYQIYEKDTIDLAKSITIHVKDVATSINNGLEENGEVIDWYKPETWKYYMNLNGEYHSTDPDPFLITSKDTLDVIEFTKENLERHPITKQSYRLGSEEHQLLVSRNIDYEMLIRGIVSPVSYEDSIHSNDYEILDYEKSLVEPDEFSLMNEIQERVNSYFYNFHNKAYCFTDNLYLPATLAILYMNLPNIILNLRLKRCLTNEAHSFHIWAHLASYGRLDHYKGVIDDYQQKYLYRNIKWITENSGQKRVFESLVRVLLSRKYMPLYGYDLRHVITHIFETLEPDTISTKHDVDKDLDVTMFDNTRTISDLIHALDNNARDNAFVRDKAIEETIFKTKKSDVDRIATKVLKSVMISESDNVEIEVREIAYYHWIYLTGKGMFSVGIELDFPDAQINAKLSSEEALILYQYCGSVLLHHRLEVVPDVYCYRIKKLTLPTKKDILNLTFNEKITEKWINDLFLRQVRLFQITSVFEFNELCYDLRKNSFYDRYYSHIMTTTDSYSNARLVTDAFWGDIAITLPDVDYSDFFSRVSINPDMITKENSSDIMKTILYNITGFDYDDEGISNTLKSLTELLAYLSSYNIQFIYDDSYYGMRRVNRTIIRFDLISIYFTPLPNKVNISRLNILKQSSSATLNELIRLTYVETITWLINIRNSYKIKSIIEVKNVCNITHTDKIVLNPIGVIERV